MEQYVFLAPNIALIGGAQIYLRNKSIFLDSKGWNVDIISFEQKQVFIEELKKYKSSIIPELRFPPTFYSKSTRQRIIELILKKIQSNSCSVYQDTIIETLTMDLALWGEEIAEKINGKHIVYLINETFKRSLTNKMYSFFDFKHKRRELAGISVRSLEMLFKNYKVLEPDESYSLRARCTNVVEEVNNPIIDSIKKSDIMIGSIGRLEKGYVRVLTMNSIAFANSNPTKRVSLVLVGGTRDVKLEMEIRRIASTCSNLELIITGFMYPIPRKLFSLVDIFVSVAGSAIVSAEEGVLTMTVDVNTGKPIGLLGYDTNSTLYSDTEQTKSIVEMLQEVLIEKEMHEKKIPIKYEQTIPDFRQRYAEHMDFIERSEQEKEYYPVNEIKLVDKRGSIKKLLFRTLGRTGYDKLVSMYGRQKAKKRH